MTDRHRQSLRVAKVLTSSQNQSHISLFACHICFQNKLAVVFDCEWASDEELSRRTTTRIKMVKFHYLLTIVAYVSSAGAFSNLPLTSQHLGVFGKQNLRQQQSVSIQHAAGRGRTLQSSASPSSFSNETAAFSTPPRAGALSEQGKAQLSLLLRSSFCAMASVATWALVKHAGMTIVQASALQGLAGCFVLPKPYALAWFCGSFAGMSAHPSALDEASLLAVACSGIFYLFEQNKLALGRGGRLGLIAFLSNLVYHSIRKGSEQTMGIFVDLVNQIRPDTAVAAAVVGAILTGVRIRGNRLGAQSPPLNQRLLKFGTQSVMLSILLGRLSAMGISSLSLLSNFAAAFVSSILAWKSQYTIFPVALLGALAGFATPQLAPAVYMGGFIGMCSLPNFRTSKFFRAAALSSVLLKLGLLGGFGGRLGFLAYVGVTFAM